MPVILLIVANSRETLLAKSSTAGAAVDKFSESCECNFNLLFRQRPSVHPLAAVSYLILVLEAGIVFPFRHDNVDTALSLSLYLLYLLCTVIISVLR